MPFTDEYLFVQIDHTTLTENPQIRNDLLKFYCNIWKYDPNFGEYRKCPVCKKYYNQHQVETGQVTVCLGTKSKPHPGTKLVEAWTEEGVWKDLEPLMLKGSDFYGAVAVVPQTKRIAGFVWGYVTDFKDISQKWEPLFAEKVYQDLKSDRLTYFQEIAVDKSFRKIGMGTVLCRMLVRWMKNKHPNLPSALHTHVKSSAFKLFQKAGYQPYQIFTEPNEGRVFMTCSQGKLLTPENLINY